MNCKNLGESQSLRSSAPVSVLRFSALAAAYEASRHREPSRDLETLQAHL